jgi:adenosine deaminase
MEKARQSFGLSVALIMCFLRHLSEEDAMQTLEQAIPFKDVRRLVTCKHYG